jgi:hypothetical protein
MIVLAASCTFLGNEFWQGDTASVQIHWTIDGLAASSASCRGLTGEADGDSVHLSVSRSAGIHEWWPSNLPSWDCAAGTGDTGMRFTPGTYIFALQLRSSTGGDVDTVEIGSVTIEAGANDLGTVDFSTAPEEEVVLEWGWTVEGHPYDEALYETLCAWAGWGSATARLVVDVDRDAIGDFHYDGNCEWGSARTDPAADPSDTEPGDDIWFAFQLLDSEGTVLAESGEWTEITVSLGSNDLGEVDFDLGDYGPLDVTVQWASDTGSSAFGDCASPPEDVAFMGYLLRYSTGEIADQVDIDTDPMGCTTDLSWIETEFDVYELVLDGDDATGSYMWGAACTGLVVDDESVNEWGCDVVMTVWP